MPEIIVLGSSNAIPTIAGDNTHLVVLGRERMVMIDCGTNPILKMEQIGIDPVQLSDVILTHFHPDHVSGVPIMLMDMWLLGRRKPLTLYGLHHTIDRVEAMMALYGWREWPDFFPIVFERIPSVEKAVVFESDEMIVRASPVHHFIPNIALRFDFANPVCSFAYSCDTEPCDEVIRLAEVVDVLIHEATGPNRGHSSAAQAGDVARKAEVKQLYLIHFPTGKYAQGNLDEDAKKNFPGEVMIARDFMRICLGG